MSLVMSLTFSWVFSFAAASAFLPEPRSCPANLMKSARALLSIQK
jgi:hypothetical protein